MNATIMEANTPITEEWLEKLGFDFFDQDSDYSVTYIKLIGDGFMLPQQDITVTINKHDLDLKYRINCYLSTHTEDGGEAYFHFENPIIYVSQLKNLYFILTGKELTQPTNP